MAAADRWLSKFDIRLLQVISLQKSKNFYWYPDLPNRPDKTFSFNLGN